MHATPPTNGTHHDHAPFTAPQPRPDDRPQATEGKRDAHGRFGKGNAGGPGNPFARQVAALRCELLAVVTPQDLAAVARELLRQAKEGNLAAARLLLSYTLGKPAATVDPDALDAQEWEGYRRVPDPAADLAVMARRMPLGLACTMGRAMLTGLTSDWTRQLADGFREDEVKRQRRAAARAERRADTKGKRPQKQSPTAPRPAKPAQGSAPALEVLSKLLEMTGLPAAPFGVAGGAAGGAPSANGVEGRSERPRPPSANG